MESFPFRGFFRKVLNDAKWWNKHKKSNFLKSSSANPIKLFINKIDTDSYLSEIKRHGNKATQSIKFYTQALPRILLFELTIVIMKWNGLWFVMNFIYYVLSWCDLISLN